MNRFEVIKMFPAGTRVDAEYIGPCVRMVAEHRRKFDATVVSQADREMCLKDDDGREVWIPWKKIRCREVFGRIMLFHPEMGEFFSLKKGDVHATSNKRCD